MQMGVDVTLNSTGTHLFRRAQHDAGHVREWLAIGNVLVTDTGGAANINCKLWDGTIVADSDTSRPSGANTLVGSITLVGIISNPVANIRISCNDVTATTGKILFNNSSNSKDGSIFGIRLQ